MATVRLFAGLREAAGTSRVEIKGETVGEVLDAAVDRFGADFASALPRARVWVNGVEAERDDPVETADEVALLPPVSGGSDRYDDLSSVGGDGELLEVKAGASPATLLQLAVASVLILASAFAGLPLFAAVVAGVVSLWVIDLATTVEGRGHDLGLLPIVLSMAGAVVSTHVIGPSGLAVGTVLAVVLSLGWGLAARGFRTVPAMAPTLLVGWLAAIATGSLLLVRREYPVEITSVLLATVTVATLAAGAAGRFSNLSFGDPMAATALGGLAATVVAAAVWRLDLFTYLLVGVVIAATLVAGRNLGMMIRSRRPTLVDDAPGWLAALDGPILAAALYYPLLRMLV